MSEKEPLQSWMDWGAPRFLRGKEGGVRGGNLSWQRRGGKKRGPSCRLECGHGWTKREKKQQKKKYISFGGGGEDRKR